MRPDLLCPNDKKSAKFAIKVNFKKMKKKELSEKRLKNKIKTIRIHAEVLKQTNRPRINTHTAPRTL